MNKWMVYFGAYGGIAGTSIIFTLIGHPISSGIPDQLFGVTLVLFLDKCIANPFWKAA